MGLVLVPVLPVEPVVPLVLLALPMLSLEEASLLCFRWCLLCFFPVVPEAEVSPDRPELVEAVEPDWLIGVLDAELPVEPEPVPLWSVPALVPVEPLPLDVCEAEPCEALPEPV
ncbi:MAG: hypothetical protein NVS9B15_09170 [Acidobacteriaceae bacterium]